MVVARVCRALVFLGVAYPQAHALHAPAHSAGAACHAALLQSMGDARRSSSGLVLPKLLGYRQVECARRFVSVTPCIVATAADL